MALYRTVLDTNEEANVEVHRQREHGLNDAATPVCHLADHVEDHPQRKLVAVFVRQRHAAIFIRAYVWSAGAEHGHIGEGHAKKCSVLHSTNSSFKKRYGRPIRVKIDNIIELPFGSLLGKQVDCVQSICYIKIEMNK